MDKAVIYLDQSALSEMFKVEMGKRGAAHEEYWRELNDQIKRVLRLQQAVFPESDVHLSETAVFRDAAPLRATYRRINGGVSFLDSEDVKRRQVWTFADAYLEGGQAPVLDFGIDGILRGRRNVWLPDLQVYVNADFSAFADGIREHRGRVAAGMLKFVKRWSKEKPSFDDILKLELEAYGRNHKAAYAAAIRRVEEAWGKHDMEAAAITSNHPAVVQHRDLIEKFTAIGFNQADANELVMDFWDWPELKHLPVHKISTYLYAAIARKISAGQKRPPSQGMMNDITAIATYGPYVDAMFVDNECAALLREAPLPGALRLKARVFCLNTRDEFSAYLGQLDARTPPDVRACAAEIYGLSATVAPAAAEG